MSKLKFRAILASVLFSGWAVMFAAYPNMWALLVAPVQLAVVFALYAKATRMERNNGN